MPALPHYLHATDIFLQLCQVVIYSASACALCHLIWGQWLIYLCSSHILSVKGMYTLMLEGTNADHYLRIYLVRIYLQPFSH